MRTRIAGFEWDAWNAGHIARHRVSPDEAEQALLNEPLFRKGRGGYRVAFGRTDEGRYLFVVYVLKAGGTARVVTARDMTPAERRYYRRQKGG